MSRRLIENTESPDDGESLTASDGGTRALIDQKNRRLTNGGQRKRGSLAEIERAPTTIIKQCWIGSADFNPINPGREFPRPGANCGRRIWGEKLRTNLQGYHDFAIKPW
jgi:hypothetical protein